MAILAAQPLALGACGGVKTVRDWGLRMEWLVERDAKRPEKPARLVEIPWSAPGDVKTACTPAPQGSGEAKLAPAPEVRAGMRVSVWRRDEKSDIRLRGTALATARLGERVSVKAGLSGATLQGIVRGAGQVELPPGKVEREWGP